MSPEITTLIFILLAVVLLALGIHIGFVLGVAGFLGIVVVRGSFAAGLGILQTTPFYTIASPILLVAPLFILMGMFSLHGGISEQAYLALYKWLGRLPGGLSIATVWANVAFGATSGASIAAASVFTKVSFPEMKRVGYDTRFALGGIAAASMLAMYIPPSIFLIIYAMLAEQSVSSMLIAGIGPGLLWAITLSVGILIIAARNPSLAPRSTMLVPWREKIASLAGIWPTGLLALIIVGGIYSGVFTPTEASAVGAFVALIICLGYRRLDWIKLRDSLLETVQITAMLGFLLIGAFIFARFLTVSGVSVTIGEFIIGLEMPPMAFLAVIMLLYLIMGCFIDGISAMAITIPVFLPTILSLEIDPVWFGIIGVMSLEIGAITPPFGLVVFTTKAAAGPDVSVEDVFRGCIRYYPMALITLALVFAFPQISIYFVDLMR